MGILMGNSENYKGNKGICLRFSQMMEFSRELREMRGIGVFMPRFGTSRRKIFGYIQIEHKIIFAYLL